MDSKQRQKAKKQFNKYKNQASEKDVEKIAAKLDGMKKGKLKEVWGDVQLMWKLIKDPKAAQGAKATAIGALVYVVSPIDAIPDIIPVFGLLDDAGVVIIAAKSLGAALKKYK